MDQNQRKRSVGLESKHRKSRTCQNQSGPNPKDPIRTYQTEPIRWNPSPAQYPEGRTRLQEKQGDRKSQNVPSPSYEVEAARSAARDRSPEYISEWSLLCNCKDNVLSGSPLSRFLPGLNPRPEAWGRADFAWEGDWLDPHKNAWVEILPDPEILAGGSRP